MFDSPDVYWKSTALMLVGSVLGVLFVSLIRRVMVEDPELPFPESVAASEVHKAGQSGAKAAKFLFYNIAVGAIVFLGGAFGVYAPDQNFFFNVGQMGRSTLRLGPLGSTQVLGAGGVTTVAGPTVSPAFLGVGYIIGPELASLNFSGSVVAWGLLIPLLIFFLGPQLNAFLPAGAQSSDWLGLGNVRLALHRAADRGRQHDGGHLLHALPHAQEPDRRSRKGDRRAAHRRRARRNRRPHRAVHEFEDRIRADRRDVPADVRAVRLHDGPGIRRRSRRRW